MIQRFKIDEIIMSNYSEYCAEMYDQNNKELHVFQHFITDIKLVNRKKSSYLDIVIDYNNSSIDKIISSIYLVKSISFFKFENIHFPESRLCKWSRLENDKKNVQVSVIKFVHENKRLYVCFEILKTK